MYGQSILLIMSMNHYQDCGLALHSNLWVQGLQADISMINGEVYFGSAIETRENGQFQTILTVDNPNFYQRIWGRNEKDIFLMMGDGLAHYNGTDIQYLFYSDFPNHLHK